MNGVVLHWCKCDNMITPIIFYLIKVFCDIVNGPHTCDGACEGGLWCRDSAPCTHVTVALPPMPSSLDITRVLMHMWCGGICGDVDDDDAV